jgi:hypothetical protein
MIEFYESASHLSIANNKTIGVIGWQALCRTLKKVYRFVQNQYFSKHYFDLNDFNTDLMFAISGSSQHWIK